MQMQAQVLKIAEILNTYRGCLNQGYGIIVLRAHAFLCIILWGNTLWIGILTSVIIIETSLGLFYDEHNKIFSSISYFSYFLVFGVVGLNALFLDSDG